MDGSKNGTWKHAMTRPIDFPIFLERTNGNYIIYIHIIYTYYIYIYYIYIIYKYPKTS